MLQLQHYHGYSHNRRFLTIRVIAEYPIDKPGWRTRGYEMRLHPHSFDQQLIFEWNGPWQYKKPYKTGVVMGLMLDIARTPDHREHGWAFSRYCLDHHDPYAGSPFVPWRRCFSEYASPEPQLPNADWSALLEIAKHVAAGRLEPLPILGWIEDNLPEPWSLLASPDPIEAFRALSPYPLFEGE